MPKIFAVSDGTATTVDLVARAALSQFEVPIEVQKFPTIRTGQQISELISAAVQDQAIVVHTLVSAQLRQSLSEQCLASGVTTVDLMGPLLSMLAEELSSPPRAVPGVFKPFAEVYLKRISALEYTVRHDDGQHTDEELESADIILLGLSRAAKTPLSIHLAYRGWKVANIPILLGFRPPDVLYKLEKPLIVGLQIDPDELLELRRAGGGKAGTSPLFYTDPHNIKQEIEYANEIFASGDNWPIIDVTHKSIEFAAEEIIKLLQARQ